MNIFIAFVLILTTIYCTIVLAKKGISGTINSIKEGWREEMNKKRSSAPSTNPKTPEGMQIVALTIGTCDSCGTKFVGTTADADDDNLTKVEFLGETKVVCKDCLIKMNRVYNPVEKTDSVKSSSGIDDIITMVTKSKQ